MKVVDVDAHIWEPVTWLHDMNPELQAAVGPIPNGLDLLFGELMARLPKDRSDYFRTQINKNHLITTFGQGDLSAPELRDKLQAMMDNQEPDPNIICMSLPGAWDPEERVKVNEEQGIDYQVLNPTLMLGIQHQVLHFHPDKFAEYVESYNTWVINTYGPYTDKLQSTAFIDLRDAERSARELRRLRDNGFRFFFHPGQPVDGKPPSHPDHDPIWGTAEELGMIPVIHVATAGPLVDPAWINTGREGEDGPAFWRMAQLMYPTVPQLAIGDMVFNGVFQRFPNLTMLCSEYGVEWFKGFWQKLGSAMDGAMGWPWELTPRETVLRNVRLSGLPTGFLAPDAYIRDPADWFIETYGPDLLWFASDAYHPEGSPTAVPELREQLSRFDESVQAKFFGQAAAETLGLDAA